MRIPTLIAAALLSCACRASQASVEVYSPALAPAYKAAVEREAELTAELPKLEQAAAEAVATPDSSDDAPAVEQLAKANKELQAIEDALAEIETQNIRDQASPFAPLLPAGLGVIALEAVTAFASKRKRKLYSSAFRALTKGQLLTTTGEILKALGAKHSTPQPEAPKAV
jgi:hypothetical protein